MIEKETPKLMNELSSKLSLPQSTTDYEHLRQMFEDEKHQTRYIASQDMENANELLLPFEYDFTKN